jgi:hypothetical protein
MKRILTFVLLLKLIILSIQSNAQSTNYNQFWNDFQFVTPIKGKWINEINIGQVWTSAPAINNDPFYTNAQVYARIWLHYILPKVKLSVFTGYNHNPEIWSIEQDGMPEIRSAVQGIYYLKKTPFTLTARLRVEDHLDKKQSKGFNERYRIRSQLKIVKPLNSKELLKGTVYLVASEELFTQTAADVFGHPRFGSNRLSVGCGYAFTNDILVDVDCSND